MIDSKKIKGRIPVEECINRGLYKIYSRHLNFGVYDKNKKGFIGIRTKFSEKFLSFEFHWDVGTLFGTASPKEFLEMYPAENIAEGEMRKATEEDKIRTTEKYGFSHFAVGDSVYFLNEPLFLWLESKEKIYFQKSSK